MNFNTTVVYEKGLFTRAFFYVYLFKNGIAVKTAVEIGELRETNKISIVKGLKTGDKVIVAGVSKLVDGDRVKLLGGIK